LDDFLVLDRFLPNLLKEQPVFFGKFCSKFIIQYLDDLRQRFFGFFGLAGSGLGNALDAIRFAFVQNNGATRNSFDAVVLQADIVFGFDDFVPDKTRQLAVRFCGHGVRVRSMV
jgi:hypothetical protein